MTDREKIIYDILCSDEQPPEGQHWEGFVTNKIVAALAQPEPEPVAWKDAPTKIYLQICDDVDCDLSFEAHDDVSWCQDKINDCDVAYVRADTAPPKKEWVGLTDAEVEKVFFDMGQFAKIDLKTFARAIEAKLKEKNT